MLSLKIYTDGGSRNNPGQAAIAGIIKKNGKTIESFAETIGKASNNEAEYRALIKALELVGELKPSGVICHSDSELMIRQMKEEYRVKNPNLKRLFTLACIAEADCGKVEYIHCHRDHPIISECDQMLNDELDGKAKEKRSLVK